MEKPRSSFLSHGLFEKYVVQGLPDPGKHVFHSGMPDFAAIPARIELPPRVPALSADTLARLAGLAAGLGISPDAALGDLLDKWEAIGKRDRPTVDELSPRLHTVTNLMLQGMARKQIAAEIGISIHTLNGYVKDIYARFEVHSQSELIRCLAEGNGGDQSMVNGGGI